MQTCRIQCTFGIDNSTLDKVDNSKAVSSARCHSENTYHNHATT